jgi:hypothetical protein
MTKQSSNVQLYKLQYNINITITILYIIHHPDQNCNSYINIPLSQPIDNIILLGS